MQANFQRNRSGSHNLYTYPLASRRRRGHGRDRRSARADSGFEMQDPNSVQVTRVADAGPATHSVHVGPGVQNPSVTQ